MTVSQSLVELRPGRRSGALVGIATLLLAASIALAQSPAEPDHEFQRLFGGYTLDEPIPEVDARIRESIERSTEPMNVLMRAMARGRLRENNPIIRRLRIGVRGQDVAVSTNGQTIAAPASGARRAMELPGGNVEASYAFADGRLHQILDYGEGTRRNTFALEPDGRLVMTSSLSAGMLPQPITYQLRFRRTGP